MAPGQCDWPTSRASSWTPATRSRRGGNFYELRKWSDEQWRQAREMIEKQNAKDKAQR